MSPAVDVVSTFQLVVVVTFVVLSGVALARAWRRGPAEWWAASAFGAMALALAAMWVPEWLHVEPPVWTRHVRTAAILAFPYLLLRFTASFRPLPRVVEVGAAVAGLVTTALIVSGATVRTWVLPIALVFWVGVSIVVVARLWRAGRGQPGVARRRMRLMAAATAVLAGTLMLAIQVDDAPWAELVTHGLVLLSAVAFGIGSAPPRALRLSWRRTEDAQLQAAQASLVQANTAEEVAARLLPPTAAILGASAVALLDEEGRVTAREGDAPALGEHVDPTRERDAVAAPLGGEHGWLVAWTSAYSPFFGPEERGLFESLAAIAGLAMQRSALLAEERHRHQSAERDRREAERARADAEQARADADAANLAKSAFLSRMSHELRTPLNAVLGFGQLLELNGLDPDGRDAVDHILKAGRHLLALIDDVLDLSRIEAGTMTVSPEPVHAGELIRDSIALVRPLAEPRNIRIRLDDDPCDRYVHTDRQRCRQVLLNLLSNAVKYNHDAGTVTISCTQTDVTTLRIAVRDTGPGIDPSRQDRLFQPFDRLGAEGSAVQGTGLGLALTRQLVERLGGTIGVQSDLGDGATFWIDLPTATAPATPDSHPPAPTATPGDTQHQILLVEDNLANLRLVEAVLRRRPGITVLPAMQGTIALELAYQHRPSMVLLDLHLPDMSGRDVLARLKADRRTRDIPVVVASADATPRRIRQLRSDGAFAYLTKPLEVQAFLDTVNAALESTDVATAARVRTE